MLATKDHAKKSRYHKQSGGGEEEDEVQGTMNFAPMDG